MSRKLIPSKRKRPFSVPIQRYPSEVCAIPSTRPPGNPFSVVQESLMYCNVDLFESIACAAQTIHSVVSIASIHLEEARSLVFGSRKILNFLNDNLGLILQRDLGIAESAEVHTYRLAAGRGNACSENMVCNSTCFCHCNVSANGVE